jgi:predicted DNA-binding ribbon-helix-helix protein
MSNSDLIKNALINEIEENLSQNTNFLSKTRIIDVNILQRVSKVCLSYDLFLECYLCLD